MKAGTSYELLIEELYKSLAKDAVVTQNDFIHGHNSNEKRQIDVSIRYKFAGTDQLIIVEAKDHKTPVDIKIVDGFISKIKDVKANKGILISAKGFSKKALEYARAAGIDALSVHSALEKRWETVLQIPVIRREFIFDLLETSFTHEIVRYLGRPVPLVDVGFTLDGGRTIFSIIELIDHYYPLNGANNKLFTREILEIPFAGTGMIGIYENKPFPIDSGVMKLQYRSLKKYYRYFTPDQYLLVKDHLTNASDLKSTVAKVEVDIREEEWVRYKNDQDLPIFGDIQTFFYEYFFFSDAFHWINLTLKKPSQKITTLAKPMRLDLFR